MREHLWQRAASFAARAHEHQVRKDGRTPYFSHPARVVTVLSVVFGCRDEVALAAAYLHDTIEDTTTDYDELKENFGGEVADIVASLTKNSTMPEREREAEYEARLAAADWRARLIKLADQYDNYADAAALGTRRIAKTTRKCRKAMALARPDAGSRPETRRALDELAALLKRK